MATDRSRTVVVGVDGSRASLAALTAAFTEAARRGREVEVVTVWPQPATASGPEGPLASRAARRRALRVQTVTTRLATRLAGVRVPVTGVLLDGDPGEILVRASVGASELVVGAPRRPGTHETGPTVSVTRRCISEAACPVRVVPAHALDGSTGASTTQAGGAAEHLRHEGVSHVGA